MTKVKPITLKVPKVTKRAPDPAAHADFPLHHLSYSAMVEFSTNPIMFKIKRLNGDKIDTTTGISGVIGKAIHRALEVYYQVDVKAEEGEAIRQALEAGTEYMMEYPEGFIEYSKKVETRQKALELVAFGINEYVKCTDRHALTTVSCEEMILVDVDIEWKGLNVQLPVPLKAIPDKIARRGDQLIITDYKTCQSYSDPDKIDGCKILQAIEYFLAVYAEYGVAPHSMVYEEIKLSKNSDGTPQVRTYEFVYADHELYFDFYFRFFADILRACNGEMVYVPNVRAMFDNEIAIISYIQRLDVREEAAKKMKHHQVSDLSGVIKSEMHSVANMRKLAKAMEGKFADGKVINYDSMNEQDKIKTKMMEHGIMLTFHSVIQGATVDLYRFTPSIGVKMSKIAAYADDIQQALGAEGVRIVAPIRGTTFVGIEVPRDERRFPALPEAKGYDIAIGEEVDGTVCRFDLRDAPHALVAGSSGSGKSVWLHSIIEQLILAGAILKLIDPKEVEFSQYGDLTITDRVEAESAIQVLVQTMEDRYAELKRLGKRDARAAGWNPIFLIIDEYADLIMGGSVQKKKTKKTETIDPLTGDKVTETERDGDMVGLEHHIQRLAQKGRAAGIHIIIATQRASTKVITGDVKVNFPVKVVFRMAKKVDSQVMLDEDGAEQLLGKGDMLFATDQGTKRLQGYKTV